MVMRKIVPFWGILLSAVFFSCSGKWPPKIALNEVEAQSSPGNAVLGNGLFARIKTTRGEIIVRLEYEKAPLTVCNFVALAEGKMTFCAGKPFYNGLTFHRVISKANGDAQDFMIQGGDPLGNGQGGPGYQFPDEFDPGLRHDGPGILSMANAGPGTNGSQFFITLVATPWLDDHHTVFGRVVEGQQVVNFVKQGDKIESVTIVRNGSAAQAFKADQAAFDGFLATAKEAAAARAKARREADLAVIAAKYPELNLVLPEPGVLTEPGVRAEIRYAIQKAGNGDKPRPGSTVRVSYTGMFITGEVFDASDAHGGPLEFTAGTGQVITGWDRLVLDMKAGEKRLAVIPPELAYGERGAGNGVIPPNSFLVFEMELVEIR
ncbi:MAG: peptidylprolyl isomerase [Treponema sp.]|jgi:peptidylprolyl isomerase|nr:peptidylprolyl isomerase [Treponema sp.]